MVKLMNFSRDYIKPCIRFCDKLCTLFTRFLSAWKRIYFIYIRANTNILKIWGQVSERRNCNWQLTPSRSQFTRQWYFEVKYKHSLIKANVSTNFFKHRLGIVATCHIRCIISNNGALTLYYYSCYQLLRLPE